jgi:hypothetical protein
MKFIILLVSIIPLLSINARESSSEIGLRLQNKGKHFSLIGKWIVYKGIPIYEYRANADSKKFAAKYKDQTIEFKQDTIISNLDELRDTMTNVNYNYAIGNRNNYFVEYYRQYIGYKKKSVTSVSCTYLNTHIEQIVTLNVVMLFFNSDTLYMSFDVVNLFLKREK